MIVNIEALSIETLAGCLAAIVVFMGTIIFYLSYKEKTRNESMEGVDENELEAEEEEQQAAAEAKKKQKKDFRNKKQSAFEHKWLYSTLKGHTAQVSSFDFSPDGKKLVSASADAHAYIWKVSDFGEKEHVCSQQNLDFDTATNVAFAPDSKSVVCSMKRDNSVAVYKLFRKDGSNYKMTKAEVSYPKKHQLDIAHVAISSTGLFIVSAAADMKIVIYNLKGDVLDILEPKVSHLHDCNITPDGRFITVCGFTTEVFVYEPKFNREHAFVSCKKVYDLKGHRSGVYGVAFNQDSSRAVTVSRDGFWRAFDTDIRYGQGQDATLYKSGEWELLKGAAPESVRLAISPTGLSFVVSVGSTIKMFCSDDESKVFEEIKEVYDGNVQKIKFSPCGKWFATCGDRYVRIFHNIPETYGQIIRLEKSLVEASGDSNKRRIREQIEEAEKLAKSFE